jgi:hypothetical protein
MELSDRDLFAALPEGEEEFNDWFIHNQLLRLDFFQHKKFHTKAYNAYENACWLAARSRPIKTPADSREACAVLKTVIGNLEFNRKWPLPADVRDAVLAERQKRAPTFTTTESTDQDAEGREANRRDQEYVEVHFPGVSLEDVRKDQDDRFQKARNKHPALRGQPEIDFLCGSIEEREKILADAENLAAGPPDHLRRAAEPEKQKRTAPASNSASAETLRVPLIVQRENLALKRENLELERQLTAALDRIAELDGSNKNGKPS